MCTLSWFHEAGGYQVFLNRDERRTRKPESPPAIRERHDVRFIAPLDGDSGGTWIAASESGITLCLLNGDPVAGPAEIAAAGAYHSRGSLPISLIHLASARAVMDELRELRLDCFRAFALAAFAPDSPPLVARWDQEALLLDGGSPEPPLISSSFCTASVRASRREVYSRVVAEGSGSIVDRHLRFHESHLPDRGPASPCMHRPDARTVSFSRVQVGEHAVRFHYSPRPPCAGRSAIAPTALTRRPGSTH